MSTGNLVTDHPPANPFAVPLQQLFTVIGNLNGMTYHLESILTKDIKSIKRTSIGAAVRSGYFLGSNLVISDVTGITDKGWKYHFHTNGQYTVGINNFEKQSQNILFRECGYAIAQSYEAFISFLKRCSAIHLNLEPETSALLSKHLEDVRGHDETSWLAVFKNCKPKMRDVDFFDFLRKLSPELNALLTIKNTINHKVYFETLAEFRHIFIHSLGKFNDEQVRMINRNPHKKKCLEELFPYVNMDGQNEFFITQAHCKDNLKTLAEQAFQFFKWMSHRHNLEWRIFNGMPESAPSIHPDNIVI